MSKFKKHLANSVTDLLKIFVMYILLNLLLRSFEFYIVTPYFPNFKELAILESKGYFHDLFKMLIILLFTLPIYTIFSYWSNKGIKLFFGFSFFVFIILSFVTIQYYIVAFVPLGKSFYEYSLDELLKILLASGDIQWFSYIVLFLLLLFFFVLHYRIEIKSKYAIGVIILLWLVAILNINKSHVRAHQYKELQEYYLVKNKALFFIDQSLSYFNSRSIDDEKEFPVSKVKEMANKYSSLYPDQEFVLPEYPLLRKNTDKDVLGKYFNHSDSVPNIVFLLLEGMGRNICGPGARYGSFTPFIDSLINHSLYWENFLSNADRTYGVLPNVLGSLPLGSNGFHNPEPDKSIFPNHQTIITYLNNYDYRTGFYHGGWNHFTNMDGVLSASNIGFMLDSFDPSSTKIKSDTKGFSWGYDDMSLIKQYLRVLNTDSISIRRRLDILLTVSLHAPFMPPNEAYYRNKVITRIDAKFPEKKKILSSFHNPLSTVMYVDDVVKHLINEYKKRADYKNTIFILCGDHNIHAFPDDNDIRKFHIPLIIFSPLLKKGEKFSAIGSHQDITPSVLAYLQNNFSFEKPKFTHMVSSGLDDHIEFRNNKAIPLFDANILKFSLLDDKYFYNDNKYYRILEGLNLDNEVPDSIRLQLDKQVNLCTDIHDYTFNKNKIIPKKYLK